MGKKDIRKGEMMKKKIVISCDSDYCHSSAAVCIWNTKAKLNILQGGMWESNGKNLIGENMDLANFKGLGLKPGQKREFWILPCDEYDVE